VVETLRFYSENHVLVATSHVGLASGLLLIFQCFFFPPLGSIKVAVGWSQLLRLSPPEASSFYLILCGYSFVPGSA
jgi:hypothetical protein